MGAAQRLRLGVTEPDEGVRVVPAVLVRLSVLRCRRRHPVTISLVYGNLYTRTILHFVHLVIAGPADDR